MTFVSAIVTVHNRATMIEAAIASLVCQKVERLEIIVVDDGSTDNSVEVIEAFSDPRIRLLRHDRNRGIPAARNTGLEAARGDYIAWLDSDDLARPDRLAKQARFLDANRHVAMIGSSAGRISRRGKAKSSARVPLFDHDDLRAQLLFRSAFQQSSIFGRAEILKAYPYRLEFPVCEDVDMFIRLSNDHIVANLPQVLIDRRLHAGQTVHQESALIRERKRALFRTSLAWLGIDAGEADLDRHVSLGNLKAEAIDRPMLEWSEHWLLRLVAANAAARQYDRRALDFATARIWLLACRAARRGPDRGFSLRRLAQSPLGLGAVNGHGLAWFAQAAGPRLGLR